MTGSDIPPLRRHSFLDRCLVGFDHALKTVAGASGEAQRPSPAATEQANDNQLDSEERRHAAGLMRVNHTGEVCAQALYQGQALAARSKSVSGAMAQAAAEEQDHLAWCEERLQELNSQPSLLNPVWYGLSFSLGALAGAAGDKASLGFIAATEDQVCQHLREHLEKLPAQDKRSRAIVNQMLADEAGHADAALQMGGRAFPFFLKRSMTRVSKLMTETSYRI